MQAGAAPKEPPHAVTQAFPYATLLDVAQRPQRLELLRGQRHLVGTGGEELRQGLVRLPLRLEEGSVLLNEVGAFLVQAVQAIRVLPEVVEQ